MAVSPRWPEALDQYAGANRRRFFTLSMMLVYLMEHIGPDIDWPEHLLQLLGHYPEMPLRAMGLPEDWHEHLRALQTQIKVRT